MDVVARSVYALGGKIGVSTHPGRFTRFKILLPAARAEMDGMSPLRRMVTAEEVAAACVFLASCGSASITGEDLNVAAGVVMY